jgi:hypothetical protein
VGGVQLDTVVAGRPDAGGGGAKEVDDGGQLLGGDRKDYDSLVDRVRGMFNLAELGALTPGEVAFAAAWNAGEALAVLPPEKFLEQALSPGSFGP